MGGNFESSRVYPPHRLTDATELVDLNIVAGTALEDANQL
jgi:hypothetical protein